MKAFSGREWEELVVHCDTGMAEDIFAMMDHRDQWERVLSDELVFRHDTGVFIQMRRSGDTILDEHVVMVWMEGMPPFKARCQVHKRRCLKLFHHIERKKVQATLDKVGVIAKLCRESETIDEIIE